MRYGGFGGATSVHDQRFREQLHDLEGSLDSAERVLHGGDCHAGINSASEAFQHYGEAAAHRGFLSKRVREFHAQKWIDVGRRLNFLRQALKGCVR